ncbi:MAG: TatD family hydrolase [Oscillospiraceae bacterium]|jgi:TatD DNase family protein|nr:TatD family hydrolase [Oscillospiraceae bacterium]
MNALLYNIFDSHAHYTDSRYNEDRDELLWTLPQLGVTGILTCGSDVPDSEAALALADKYNFIYAACGVHPHEAKDFDETAKRKLPQLLSHPKCIALGEIGLDYHYDFSPRNTQKEVFCYQLALAKEIGKPVVLHDREAHADTLQLVREAGNTRGVIHAFSGGSALAFEWLALGYALGFGGPVTFKPKKGEAMNMPLSVAAQIPLDRILLETDAPYLTPHPYRGKRNDSAMIAYVAETIAAARNMNPQELLDISADNAKRIFGVE